MAAARAGDVSITVSSSICVLGMGVTVTIPASASPVNSRLRRLATSSMTGCWRNN